MNEWTGGVTVLEAGEWGVFKALAPRPELVRYVVDTFEDGKGLVYQITSGREWRISAQEQREPVSVGFRAQYLIRRATEDEIAEEMERETP